MFTKKKLRPALIAQGIALALACSTSVLAAQKSVDIQAQSLAGALKTLEQQTGLQFIYQADLIAGKQSSAVKGSYEYDEALQQLLNNSNVTFSISGNTVTLSRVAATTKYSAGNIKQLALTKVGSVDEQMTSVGRNLQDYPGSATIISSEKIDQIRPLSVIDIMKTVPGVYAHDEYGRGLRPNIGFRGMNPSRSQTGTLLLADGVPIQPALYGAKGAYYGIPVDNIDHIEVVKGGSSVLLGPGNIGGTVNFITTNPPKEKELRFKETIRQGGLYQTYLSVGDTNSSGQGYLLSFNNMTGSTDRENSKTNTSDLSLKLTTPLSGGGNVWTRFNYFSEKSDTPGEISPEEFEDSVTNSNRSNDKFEGKRVSADLHIDLPLSKNVDLETLTYLSYYERNWQIGLAPDSTNTGNNHYERAFVNLGIEPRIRVQNLAGGHWTFGTRLHYENRDEVRIRGGSPTASNGDINGVSNMSSTAISPYVEGEYTFDQLTIIAGLRQEIISQSARNIQIYKDDGSIGRAGYEGSKDTSTTLGSLAATYKLNDSLNVYGGINRAMQPLSFKYTADPTYEVVGDDLESEIGTTIELGLRGEVSENLYFDADIFTLAYDNQVIRDGVNSTNGGSTTHRGLETSVMFAATEDLNFDVNYTYVNATIDNNDGGNEGNKLPMAPENILAWGVTYDVSTALSLRIDGLFTDERFSNAANTVEENASGSVGMLDAHHIMNIRADYQFTNKIQIFAGINNFTDEKVKQRRKRGGISPGLPLSAYIGIDARF